MKRSGHPFRRFLSDDRGATAIEYGILGTMIGIALVGLMSFGGVAEQQGATYETIANHLKSAN